MIVSSIFKANGREKSIDEEERDLNEQEEGRIFINVESLLLLCHMLEE